jgi:energy-coupling factor transport system ATP-binding protein
MLELRGVEFAYDRNRRTIGGIDLTLEPGGRLAVVGSNGSGKTTLARLMCGLLRPASGSVRVNGLDTRDQDSIYEIRRRVGLVFQDPDHQMVETTVEREVAFGLRNLGLEPGEVEDRARRALEVFGVGDFAGRLTHLLSAGEKQLVAIASVFAMEPEFVILDESTALLDAGARRRFTGALERLLEATGAGLVFISMRLEDVWLCEHAVRLESGRICYRGDRAGLVGDLRSAGHRLPGTGGLLMELDRLEPGFAGRLKGRELTGKSLARVISRRREGGWGCP